MLPTRGLEYDEELPSPTHTTAINSLKEFASGLCQAWNNQTHPYHWAFFERTYNKLVNIGKVDIVADTIVEKSWLQETQGNQT